jgi:hypothetical protein
MTVPPPSNEPGQRPEPDVPTWARRPTNNNELSDQRLATFIGSKWEGTYRRKFAPFLSDPAFTPTWNWSAFLATPLWFLYRKLYLPFVLFMFAPTLIATAFLGPRTAADLQGMTPDQLMQSSLPYFAFEISSRIAAAGTANWLLFRRARAATRFVTMQPWSESESQVMLARLGGVHRGPTILLSVLFLAVTVFQILGQRPA